MKLIFYITVVAGFLFGHLGCSTPKKQVIELSEKNRVKCLEVLRAGLLSDDFWPAMHAAEALTLGGHGEEVIEKLETRLPIETDDQRRCGLARELVRAGKKNYAQVMLEILAGDDPHGHVHAAESLYKVGVVGDETALRRAFADTSNVILQLMAAAALGRQGDSESMEFLRKQIKTGDHNTARIASWVLARIGSKDDIPEIRRRRDISVEKLQRVFHENSLALLGDDEGLQSFERNLVSEEANFRTYAATFVGDARATQYAPQLIALLDDPHLDTRIRAAQSLLVLSKPSS